MECGDLVDGPGITFGDDKAVEGGFVFKHIKEAKSDPLVSIKSTVDNMSDLYDLERNDIGILSDLILQMIKNK